MLVEAYLRSLLFVPGDDAKKLAKAPQLPADAIIIDWEDAVALEHKTKARTQTIEAGRQQTACQKVILVRINPVFSPEFPQDCEAIQQCAVDGIMLSKCRSAEDVQVLNSVLDRTDALRECSICPLIESPVGLMNSFSIVTSSDRVTMLAFGAEDFSAEMGIVRSETELELLYARSRLVTNARAGGRDAVDSPCTDLRDPERVRAAAHHARNLGFTGKLAIHPSQIEIINRAFAPSEQELDEARHAIAAASARTGAFALEGRMVDEPVLKRARQILRRSSHRES
jgi:citrate lyase subunit beta / citryl-CoA lyase